MTLHSRVAQIFQVIVKRAPKALDACENNVSLSFPTYPDSGDMTKQAKLKKIIKAYNAVVVQPCSDDYRFDIVVYPPTTSANLYTPPGKKTPDLWNGEHVMDAQLVQDFISTVGKHLTAAQMPVAYRESPFPTNRKMEDPDGCDYLYEFWNERKDPPTSDKAIDAMTYLLQVYPGKAGPYTKEMTLLPGRLNGKKERLFSGNGKNIIAPDKWKKAAYDEKINELRECILLVQVWSTP
ncbi:hypothetical protein N0V86_009081 [Didymella sp. IMI 355093]|nr:hypothetical protein N0V86_009081 [Didymella sp. IMI 355093]